MMGKVLEGTVSTLAYVKETQGIIGGFQIQKENDPDLSSLFQLKYKEQMARNK